MSYSNVWLKSSQEKKFLQSIDSIFMEAWSNDMTLGDTLSSLSEDEFNFLMKMKISSSPLTTDEDLELSLTTS